MSKEIRPLDEIITASLRDGIACHGDLGLASAVWTGRVREVLHRCDLDPSDRGAAEFVGRLCVRDLYLATSCAERLEGAWHRFARLYQRYIQEIVRARARSGLEATDVAGDVLVDLFLPNRTGHSRIASHDGRSSLATWLHVIVAHRVANERARKWNAVERPGDMPEVPDVSQMPALEASLRSKRYRRAVDESIRKACDGLSARDKQILMWRYQRGLLLDDIARLLSIHPSTACRQLVRVQNRLRTVVVTSLVVTYGVPETAIAECLNDVCRNGAGSFSVLRLIGGRPRGARRPTTGRATCARRDPRAPLSRSRRPGCTSSRPSVTASGISWRRTSTSAI